MRKVVRGKLHGIRVTGADLDYHGSITLDPDHCEAAGILPMEFVDIWNKNSGARISTYVIYGERGSRCCILNGAAARTCQRGDEV
ncbi:MAG TPA: aspartate 1-decarboxylase, partial [Pusillimonas sp.]